SGTSRPSRTTTNRPIRRTSTAPGASARFSPGPRKRPLLASGQQITYVPEGTMSTQTTQHRKFGTPDETRTIDNDRLVLLRVGGSDIGRLVLKPGWRWSNDVKPLAGTELCEAPHFQYHVAGTLRIAMADGTTFDAVPGDVTSLPSGHDAWVVGDE